MSQSFNRKNYLTVGAFIFAAGLLFGPLTAKAATTVYLDLENPKIYEGDTFLVKIKISTPDTLINVIDGTMLYDNKRLEIKEISTGGSFLALWPKPPVFSNEKGNLSFVGGTPDGFQGEKGDVLKIIFLARNEGEATLDFLNDDFSVFLHDGKGTRINPRLEPLSLNILPRAPEIPVKDEWQALIEKDKTSPKSFEITLGKDPSIFDNQYFISFFTTDAESGVAYYEVQEGDGNFIRAESPHLLKDQSLKRLIKVKAVDKAGNERIEELMPPAPDAPFYKNILFWIAVCIVIIIGIFYVFWRNFRRKIKI